MRPRMMCTECFRTAEAGTVLEGSDIVEMIAWVCFGVPGLLYCWWRHALRIKVCPVCGSSELVREARAAAARSLPRALPAAENHVCNLSGPVRWPQPFAVPRERLRHGFVLASLAGSLFVCLAMVALGISSHASMGAVILRIATACGGWILYEVVRVSRVRAKWASCKAWDRFGRPLQIERVY
jgi:hypothetical protein